MLPALVVTVGRLSVYRIRSRLNSYRQPDVQYSQSVWICGIGIFIAAPTYAMTLISRLVFAGEFVNDVLILSMITSTQQGPLSCFKLSFFSFFFGDSWSLIQRCSPFSWADSLRSHVVLHEWLVFYSVFLNIHRSGVLTALAWLVPPETAAVSARSVYTIQPCTMSLHAKPHT